jgi:hypothetical protein
MDLSPNTRPMMVAGLVALEAVLNRSMAQSLEATSFRWNTFRLRATRTDRTSHSQTHRLMERRR